MAPSLRALLLLHYFPAGNALLETKKAIDQMWSFAFFALQNFVGRNFVVVRQAGDHYFLFGVAALKHKRQTAPARAKLFSGCVLLNGSLIACRLKTSFLKTIPFSLFRPRLPRTLFTPNPICRECCGPQTSRATLFVLRLTPRP